MHHVGLHQVQSVTLFGFCKELKKQRKSYYALYMQRLIPKSDGWSSSVPRVIVCLLVWLQPLMQIQVLLSSAYNHWVHVKCTDFESLVLVISCFLCFWGRQVSLIQHLLGGDTKTPQASHQFFVRLTQMNSITNQSLINIQSSFH